MLTLKELESLRIKQIFRSGEVFDYLLKSYRGADEVRLRWIAVKGNDNTWCIYFGLAFWETARLQEGNLKIRDMTDIKMLVRATDEVYKRYRIW